MDSLPNELLDLILRLACTNSNDLMRWKFIRRLREVSFLWKEIIDSNAKINSLYFNSFRHWASRLSESKCSWPEMETSHVDPDAVSFNMIFDDRRPYIFSFSCAVRILALHSANETNKNSQVLGSLIANRFYDSEWIFYEMHGLHANSESSDIFVPANTPIVFRARSSNEPLFASLDVITV